MTDSSLQPMAGSPATEDPDRLARRLIQRAWNRDGVPEIAIGLFFMMLAGLFEVQHLLEKEWGVFRAIPLTMFPILLGGFLIGWGVKFVRSRWLIDRSGYVEMKPPARKHLLRVVIIGTISTIVAAALVVAVLRTYISYASARQWVFVAGGVFCGLLLPACGRSMRFVLSGALIAATGILLGILNVDYDPGWTIFYGVAGVVTTISGTVALISFLRETREAGAEGRELI
jgi:hypothetical protein